MLANKCWTHSSRRAGFAGIHVIGQFTFLSPLVSLLALGLSLAFSHVPQLTAILVCQHSTLPRACKTWRVWKTIIEPPKRVGFTPYVRSGGGISALRAVKPTADADCDEARSSPCLSLTDGFALALRAGVVASGNVFRVFVELAREVLLCFGYCALGGLLVSLHLVRYPLSCLRQGLCIHRILFPLLLLVLLPGHLRNLHRTLHLGLRLEVA